MADEGFVEAAFFVGDTAVATYTRGKLTLKKGVSPDVLTPDLLKMLLQSIGVIVKPRAINVGGSGLIAAQEAGGGEDPFFIGTLAN